MHMGFSFSAGLTDVFFNWGISTKPWLLIPVGLVFAAIYYTVFRFAITKFNLPTPGREPEEEVEDLTKA
jgi:PTS system N-acetylglucosamine-specific IIC component